MPSPSPPSSSRRRWVRSGGLLLASAWWRSAAAQGAALQPGGRPLPDLGGAVAWLQSEPLSARQLRGQVVLVQFWTFTCVNWLRTLPYIQAWSRKYRAQGLVVLGIHTPEFGFEESLANVRRASGQLGIEFPVAVDSQRQVWQAFGNRAWPALYLVDAAGRIRWQHDGEGQYAATERMLQQLLGEAGAAGVPTDLVQVQGRGAQAPADWASLKTPEIYLRALPAERVAAAQALVAGRRQSYRRPPQTPDNHWSLSGDWTVTSEAARAEHGGAQLTCRFHARDVNLVMGCPAAGAAVNFTVRINGRPPGAAHGVDTDSEGRGTASSQRLYALLRQPGAIAFSDIEITFDRPGVEVYALTFG
ncbi:redoxin domain-containing protein [Aquincola sp. J276]|uniref:redoxin domain-containing protein n=1 Tax=Aquincola sp. J276 TaxID=2898432 RepID=UPI0021511CD4|nr:redoxin domain-containing protein [Aquincola sp. J276]MCR5864471.1 redoxin domain-containing protein [Aquincola sp. J276]